MTQNELIQIAKQAGWNDDLLGVSFVLPMLETFSKLIAAHVSRELAKECASSGEWNAVHIIERVEW